MPDPHAYTTRPVDRYEFMQKILAIAVLQGHTRLKVSPQLFEAIAAAYIALGRATGFDHHPHYRPMSPKGVHSVFYRLYSSVVMPEYGRFEKDVVDIRLKGEAKARVSKQPGVNLKSLKILMDKNYAARLLGNEIEMYQAAAADIAWN